MERYRCQRKREVSAIRSALEACGVRILDGADPSLAPFVFRVLTPGGETLELICYVFSANKYRQGGRPIDEHRFQVKYGSDFQRYHEIYLPPEAHRVTLMLGCHFEEEVFVAVDPAMHNPTWFSSSVEFKDEQVARVQETGWYGWERSRSDARRKRRRPMVNCQTEVVLGFKARSFLRYVQFERIASGLDAGERLLWVDRLAGAPVDPSDLSGPMDGAGLVAERHRLEVELGLPANQILDMIEGAFRLKVAVRGAAAEEHLEEQLRNVPGLHDVRRIDEDGRPDFEVHYRGRGPLFVECKNVLRRQPRGETRVDFQKTRASKNDPCSRYYRPQDFEVLAACLHPVTENWEYRFAATSSLPKHRKCPEHLSNRVVVGSDWATGLDDLLDRTV